jgi:hypothetical protein
MPKTIILPCGHQTDDKYVRNIQPEVQLISCPDPRCGVVYDYKVITDTIGKALKLHSEISEELNKK